MGDTLQIIKPGCLGFVEMDYKVKLGERKGEEWEMKIVSKRGKLN